MLMLFQKLFSIFFKSVAFIKMGLWTKSNMTCVMQFVANITVFVFLSLPSTRLPITLFFLPAASRSVIFPLSLDVRRRLDNPNHFFWSDTQIFETKNLQWAIANFYPGW